MFTKPSLCRGVFSSAPSCSGLCSMNVGEARPNGNANTQVGRAHGRLPARPGSCENAQFSPHQFLQTFSRLLSCFLLFHDRTSLEGGRREKQKAHDSFYAIYARTPMSLRSQSSRLREHLPRGEGSSSRAALPSGAIQAGQVGSDRLCPPW